MDLDVVNHAYVVMYNGKLYMEFIVYTVIGLWALWCLTPLSTIHFSYIVVVCFIDEGTRSIYFSIGFWSCFQCDMFCSFYYSTIRYSHDSLIAKMYWPVTTGSMCKIIPNKTGYEKFTINMNFDVAIYKTKTHGTSNLQNIEDSSSKLEWNINYNY